MPDMTLPPPPPESVIRYAYLVYNYNKHFLGYAPKEVNVGDYIQTLAATAFYPKSTCLEVDRDSLSRPVPSHSKIKIIANGWYRLNDAHHVIHPNFDPLLVAVHINGTETAGEQKQTLDCLKRLSKVRAIGCRDLKTQRFLLSHGIDAYFSSCLTTTLDRNRFVQSSKRQGLVVCDLPNTVLTGKFHKLFPLPYFLRYWTTSGQTPFQVLGDTIKSFGNDVTRTTHLLTLKSTHAERFSRANELLKIYASAKLVLTSRIHCALPCLALGTPVVLIAPYDRERYEGLGDLLNHIYLKNGRVIETSILKGADGAIVNPTSFKPYADKLRTVCTEFMKNEETELL